MSDSLDPLWLAGYAVLPQPRQVALTGERVAFVCKEIRCGDGVETADAAVRCLEHFLEARDLRRPDAVGPLDVTLSVAADAAAGAPEQVADQAYRIDISADAVAVIGAAPAGLFYGVQTLGALLDAQAGILPALPLGTITDWPAVQRRIIHLDTKHHQDRFETLLTMLDRLAAFKINAVAWEIEDKFAYQGHPEIGAPGAFTAEQVAQLVKEALRRHIQIIPILQGPSHMAYVLKHESLAHLREDPTNNYMICSSRPESWELIFEMYDEILDATEGCDYFFIGTDEAYFLGDGVDCGCAARAKEVGPSGIFCDFVNKAADHVRKRGRTPLCWGESPLEEADLTKLPTDLIDGVAGGGQRVNSTWWKTEDELGIRRLVYVSTQGGRKLFPGYFHSEKTGDTVDAGGRVETNLRTYRSGLGHPTHGTFTAAWDDSGLHNETFWLGWVLGAAAGWHVEAVDPQLMPAQFMRQFYGPGVVGMVEAYSLLDLQARFWSTSWDIVAARRGYAIMKQYHERHDSVLAPPNVPDLDRLDNAPFFAARNADRLRLAATARPQSDRLITILLENIPRATRNVYNLEVLLAIARFCRHNIDLLLGLAGVERVLTEARDAGRRGEHKKAVARLNAAADRADALIADGRRAFEHYRATYEKSCYPKGRSVDGRDFVHIMDDTKDHPADRRADLTFLIEREQSLDLPGWLKRLRKVAAAHAADLRP